MRERLPRRFSAYRQQRCQIAAMQVLDASYPSSMEDDLFDDHATAVFDAQLLEAVELVNMDLKQQTRQVVLLGCGLDTRPYRHVSSPANAFCNHCSLTHGLAALLLATM